MEKKVLIIGAGIIGLYLAWKLSQKGNKVFLFEKKSREKIKDKACSTLVSERIKNFIPLNESIIENEISGCLINFPKKIVNLNFLPVHLILNRGLLIVKLLNLAEESGAKIFFEKEAREFPKDFDRIIGCDGAMSFVRQAIFGRQVNFKLGIQVFLEEKDCSGFVQTWPTISGFCWKIPRKNSVEYGILESHEKAMNLFLDFLEKNEIKNRVLRTNIKSALIPQGLFLPDCDNITLCGDAAGLCKPWSGGGIIWGLTAADILVEKFPDFKEYKKETEKFFQPKILKGKISNNLVHFFGNKFPYIFPSKIDYDNDWGRVIKIR